jgi:hypothetical protein
VSPGARVRLLRIVLGVSREVFCRTHGINLNTLVSIELDRLKISQKQMQKLLAAFAREGLNIDEAWIREARGQLPARLARPDMLPEQWLEGWARFFCDHRNAVLATVQGSAMEPFYSHGDLVGGLWHDNPTKLSGRRCIVQMTPASRFPGSNPQPNASLMVDGLQIGLLLVHEGVFSLMPSNTSPAVSYRPLSFVLSQARVAEIVWHIHRPMQQIPELGPLESHIAHKESA